MVGKTEWATQNGIFRARLRALLGKRAAPIAADVAKLSRGNERMARVAANYFLDMAETIAAVVSQMTRHATFAFRVSESSLGGVEIDTPEHLEGIVAAFGFGPGRDVGEFLVLAR